MQRLILTVALWSAVLLPAAAQSVPINPQAGKVTESEVAFTVYQKDTSAAAVVLLDNTRVSVRTSDIIELTKEVQVYERIKILKEDGKSWADYKIPYHKDESISGIKVTTYNLENGKVVKSTLDKKHIFKEAVSENVYTCSFSAPDVRVGSVIEVSYKLEGDRFWDLPDITLQRSIPVNIAYMAMLYPDFVSMNRTTRGYLSPDYTQTNYSLSLSNSVLPQCRMITDQYSMVDIPAIPREPSNMSPSHYRCAVSYELSGITIPGRLYKSYSKKWEDIDAQILDSRISSQCYVKGKFLEPFQSKAQDEVQAIAEVRGAVVAAVKWDDVFSWVPDNVRNVLKAGTGSSASINAVVASVLNQMGYRVHPVVLRRRSAGPLNPQYVNTDAFTSMILYIRTPSGEVHFLDAAPDYGYVDVLDPNFLVDAARVVVHPDYGQPFWQDLTSLALGTTAFVVNAQLGTDGLVKGTIQASVFKEASYLVRETRDDLETDEKYFQMVESGEDFEMVSGTFTAEDYSPSVDFLMEFEQEATTSGEMVYIKPFLVREHHQGDFPPGERHLPVDFPFKETIAYTYNLQIPEGYVVEQLPASASFRPTGLKLRALCQVQQVDANNIRINFSYRNDTLQIPASSYVELRSFWEKLCNIYLGTIVLKKQ